MGMARGNCAVGLCQGALQEERAAEQSRHPHGSQYTGAPSKGGSQ